MNLSVLWQYMQVDMEADSFETKMRQSENRQKLMKQRKFIKDQQANMTKLEAEVSDMSDRLDAINDEAERLEKQLEALLKSIETEAPKTVEEAKEKAEAIRKLNESIIYYEQELRKVRKDADQKDASQKQIRSSAAKMLAEYNALKKVYDVEFAADEVQLKKLRSRAEREAKKVDGELLEHYRSIKQHVVPPMAKLVGGQCTGCFMSLPNAILHRIKDENARIECDNCGRLLYIPD